MGNLNAAAQEPWALGACDIIENKQAHIIKADAPGLTSKDIKVQLKDGNMLTISGERSRGEEDKGDRTHRRERNFGRFRRHFRLPKNIDASHITANVEHGVVSITIPKIAPQISDIQVSAGKGDSMAVEHEGNMAVEHEGNMEVEQQGNTGFEQRGNMQVEEGENVGMSEQEGARNVGMSEQEGGARNIGKTEQEGARNAGMNEQEGTRNVGMSEEEGGARDVGMSEQEGGARDVGVYEQGGARNKFAVEDEGSNAPLKQQGRNADSNASESNANAD